MTSQKTTHGKRVVFLRFDKYVSVSGASTADGYVTRRTWTLDTEGVQSMEEGALWGG